MKALFAAMGALVALSTVAWPVAAATVVNGCQGTCGQYETFDASVGKKGADCVYYTNNSYSLRKITVRPPEMFGHYSAKTPVDWRFRIQISDSTSAPYVWTTDYVSSYQSARASRNVPANVGKGFARRAWNAPDAAGARLTLAPISERYRVLIDMRWWHNGSVEGSTSVRYDWYSNIEGSNSYTNHGNCPGVYVF